jgi:glycosyltransferase involved in cell wall biosynthesis
MTRLSVIVPAYNVEAYIDRCVKSLLGQGLDDMEIVLIDEGSTDDTARHLDALRTSNPDRIRVISKGNSGSSASARNAGMSDGTSEWIGFVDGDDWVSPNMFSHLLAATESQNLDVAICGGCLVDDCSGDVQPFQDFEIWRRLLEEHNGWLAPLSTPDLFLIDASVCRRVYRRRFLHEIGFSFADGFLFEDIAANFEILLKATKVALVDHDGYFYRIGHAGRITDRHDKALLDAVEMVTRAAQALASVNASPDIWANFIYYQSWVLTWLGGQIEPQYANLFAKRATRLSRQFPAEGINRFKKRYEANKRSLIAVCLQCQHSGNLFRQFTTGRISPSLEMDCLEWGQQRP